jgi:hypothetical protein
MTNLQESEITFPVGGIFGVGRLATMLKALAESGRIGPWHIGHLDRLPAHRHSNPIRQPHRRGNRPRFN